MIQACTFAYHCARFCSQIKNVPTDNLDLVLATYSSISQQLDEMEKIWSSTWDFAQPSASSIGVHAYQGNFQMHLSSNFLSFLLRVFPVGCSQQHINSTAMQERCITIFRATATKVLHVQGITQGIDRLHGKDFNLGWADAVMIYGPLRTISVSPISLDWQRMAATKALAMIKKRLGFRILP